MVVANDFGSVTGGASRVAIGSALGLAAGGLDVTYFCAAPPLDARLEQARGLETVCLGQPDILTAPNRLRAAMRGLWNVEAARAMSGVLARRDPEHTVVHFHSFTKALTVGTIRAAVRLGFQTCITLHDYFIVCPNGGLYDYQAARACSRRPMSPACLLAHCDARRRAHKLWRSLRQVVQNAALAGQVRVHYLFTSRFNRELLAGLLPGPGRTFRVDNPVEVEKTSRVPAEVNRAVVFLGKISCEKGVLLLAAAARAAGVPVVFIGEGPAAAELNAGYPEFPVTGWLSGEALAAVLGQARCLVFPSLWYESQPLAPLEALARGIPVVVSAGSAAREYVIDGENGYLFPTGDTAALAERLRLLSDDALVARLSANAHEAYWRDPPTPERYAAQLLAVYEEMLTSD